MNYLKNTTKQTGDQGEHVARQYLKTLKYTILDTNFSKKWGEIDIIAKKDDIVHFIEVKTVSYETKTKLLWAISNDYWRPEEQVTNRKLHQIHKVINTWTVDNKYTGNFVIDVIALRIVPHETYATVNFIENII